MRKLLTAGLLGLAIPIAACTQGIHGATNGNPSYQQGLNGAGHELVVSQMHAGTTPVGACEHAYNVYSMTANLDKAQYIQGCDRARKLQG
jgi:hypothetical protein